MGQEIVYCFKCQKRILGSDYAKGHAYQLENSSCCSGCAVQVLETLAPKAREQLLAKMFRETHDKQSVSSGGMKSMPGPSPASSTRKIPVQPGPLPRPRSAEPSSAPLFLGIAGAVAFLIILAVVFGSGSSTPPPPPPPAAKKIVPPEPVRDPGPSPEEKRRADAAREAMRKAAAFAQSNPKDFDGQVREWKVALLEAERTGYEAEAKRELEKSQVRAKEALGQEIAALEREVKGLAERKDFRGALDVVGRERPRRSGQDWTPVIERLDREIQDAMARRFAELKDKALVARDRGATADLTAIKAEVARWGVVDHVAELDAALETAWRPIFDGRSTACLSSHCKDWMVENGALVRPSGSDAGQSREDFGDGEIRFRFASRNCTHVWFGVRQGEGIRKADFNLTDLNAMGPGPHELVFLCRGEDVTATLNGKPITLQHQGKKSLKGRLQFNFSQGTFQVLGIDHRPLK